MLKRLTINRIDPVSVGKILGSMYAVMGLFIGMFMGAITMLDGGINRGNGPFGNFGVVLGGMILILAPIGYGLMGFISGVLMSLLYNLAAGFMGGFVLEVVDESEDDDD